MWKIGNYGGVKKKSKIILVNSQIENGGGLVGGEQKKG